jgi:5'-nucleotidase
VGLAISLRTPLQIEKIDWEDGITPAWRINGTPADCIKLALGVILDETPDLIVSGINHGSNSGRTLLYSGTVGGVIEGALRNVPGIAFSFSEILNPDYSLAAKHIYPIVEHALNDPLPRGTVLNVNFPKTATPKGLRMARQGRSYWIDSPDERLHPEGTPYFWLAGRWDDHEEPEDSDVSLLKEGFITAVPIHVDELTDHKLLENRRGRFDRLF